MPANVSGGSPGDSGSSTVSSSPCSETAGALAAPDDAPVRAVSGLERDRLEESGDEERRTGDAGTAAPGIARWAMGRGHGEAQAGQGEIHQLLGMPSGVARELLSREDGSV